MSPSLPSAAPEPRGPLLGRDAERERILELIGDHTEVLTLVGAPGVGKTRLALEVARRLEEGTFDAFQEVCWLSCRDMRAPEALVREMGSVLDLHFDEAVTLQKAQTLIGRALERFPPALFVVDNLEQTTQQARELLPEWSRADIGFLATSREPLEVDNERTYRLEPLSLDAAEKLYVRSAPGSHEERSGYDVESLRELIDRLDGHPLSVEIAGSLARTLPPSAALERLDRPLEMLSLTDTSETPWSESLRESVALSWRELSPDERLGLAQLTVFENGATLAAAEEVVEIGRETSEPSTVELLENLCRRSLVRRRDGGGSAGLRFELDVPVRAFAESVRGDFVSQTELQERHTRFYVDFARDAFEQLTDASTDLAIDRIRLEVSNLARAMDRALEVDPPGAAIIAEVLRALHAQYGIYPALPDDRASLFEDIADALERLDSDQSEALEVRMRYRQYEALFAGRDVESVDFARTFRSIGRRAEGCGEDVIAFLARDKLGWLYRMRGDLEGALDIYDDCVRRARSNDLDQNLALSLTQIAELNARLGRTDRAREAFREAEVKMDASHAQWNRGNLYLNWAELELGVGAPGEAASLVDRASRAFREYDEPRGIAFARSARSIVSLLGGEAERALGEIHDSLEQHAEHGREWRRPLFLCHAALIRIGRNEPEEAAEVLERSERLSRRHDAEQYLHATHALQAIAAYRGGDRLKGEAREQRARESDRESAILRVVRAERELTEAERALEEEELKRASFHISRASRLGRAVQPSEEPFYLGSYRAFVASRLFEARFENYAARAAQEVPDADEWLVVEARAARWFQTEGAPCVDLTSRGSLRRILHGLVTNRLQDEGARMSVESACSIGWPEESVDAVPESRVYNTVARLRRGGLDGIIRKDDEGYYLHPECLVLARDEPFEL